MSKHENYATYSVELWLDNDEGLYVLVQEMLDYIFEQYATDSDRIDAIADQLELAMRDFYLNGTETDAGSYVIRSFLDDVWWSELARRSYVDYLARREELV